MEHGSKFESTLFSSNANSSVINFYNNRSVFVTGATGFLGTVLIEKLLYSCEGIKCIYILVKNKRGQTAEARMTHFLNSEAFDRLRKRNENFMSKIIPLNGNITEKRLGLSDENIAVLRKEVSVVFHSAARLSFGMSLKDAFNTNTKATDDLLTFCKDLPLLRAFVYVSTAYSNCNKYLIEEKVYKTGVPLDIVCEVLDKPQAHNLLDGRPNTYTFSKALSEEIIEKNANAFPSVIVRPSIITSAVSDPVPGWLAGWNGLTFLIHAATNKHVNCWHVNDEALVDTIPVDYTVNLMIVSAWEANKRWSRGDKDVKVFNCCSGLQNPINSGNFVSMSMGNKKARNENIKKPSFFLIQNYYLYTAMMFFLNIVPAILKDCVCWLFVRKMRSLNNVIKYMSLTKALSHFTLKEFVFVDTNMRKLCQSLSETDKVTFEFDVSKIHWTTYLEDYANGIKKMIRRSEITS